MARTAIARLTRRQAIAASAIIGHVYRHRLTSRTRTVTDVERRHRPHAEPIENASHIAYAGERIRIVLDGTVRVSPQTFERDWVRVR